MDIALVAAAIASSASIVKAAVSIYESLIKRGTPRASVEIKKSDGTTVKIEIDPEKEESVRKFLKEIEKPSSGVGIGREQ